MAFCVIVSVIVTSLLKRCAVMGKVMYYPLLLHTWLTCLSSWWFLQCMKHDKFAQCTEIWNKLYNAVVHISRNHNDESDNDNDNDNERHLLPKKIRQSYQYTIQLKGLQLSRSTMKSNFDNGGRSNDLCGPSSCKRQVYITGEQEQSARCKVDNKSKNDNNANDDGNNNNDNNNININSNSNNNNSNSNNSNSNNKNNNVTITISSNNSGECHARRKAFNFCL